MSKDLWKQAVVVLVPFVFGHLTSSSFFIMELYLPFIWAFGIAMTIYWWWAGIFFAQKYDRRLKGYLIGNSFWGISLLIYTFEFLVMSDTTRHLIPAVYSQSYALFFIPYASAIMSQSDVLNGTVLQMIAYGVMLLVFTGGYVSIKHK